MPLCPYPYGHTMLAIPGRPSQRGQTTLAAPLGPYLCGHTTAAIVLHTAILWVRSHLLLRSVVWDGTSGHTTAAIPLWPYRGGLTAVAIPLRPSRCSHRYRGQSIAAILYGHTTPGILPRPYHCGHTTAATPLGHIGDGWTALRDTIYVTLVPLPASPAHTHTTGATSAWLLQLVLSGAPLVVATACPNRGSPRPHSAFVFLPVSPTGHWPHFFCTSPHKAASMCTLDIAPRRVVDFHGLQLPGAVPVSAIPRATPCAPPPDPLLQPTTLFVLSLPNPRLPPATPTNFTTRHGSPRSTAIDHIFATGPIASHTHHVLPCHTSHAMVLAQVTLHHRACDAHSWRLFRWRLATIEDMDSLSAALDLAWGWLSLTPSLPDHYIAAHHSLAHQLVPLPPDTPTLLRSVARFTFPLSTQDLAAQSSTLREASAARGYVSRAAVLSSPCITSATRTVLRLPSPPLEPFHGILPHPGATIATREERLAEVTAQSRSQTANRHVSVDHAFFAARCTPDPWLPLLHPPTDLTLPLLRNALRANARPESPASLRAYALTRQSPPPHHHRLPRPPPHGQALPRRVH